MSELSIPEVSSIPNITHKAFTVQRVHKNASGEYVSNCITYTVTVYDHHGRIITTHNNYRSLGVV